MSSIARTEEDLKWQRRSDARTLAEAESIKADKERFEGARIGAKEILTEERARLNGLSKVAGRKNNMNERPTNQSPKTYRRARPAQGSLPSDIPDVFRR